jgi:hypothetical protein
VPDQSALLLVAAGLPAAAAAAAEECAAVLEASPFCLDHQALCQKMMVMVVETVKGEHWRLCCHGFWLPLVNVADPEVSVAWRALVAIHWVMLMRKLMVQG